MDDATDDDGAEQALPSCAGCRKRKLKCSRQKPSCSHCERLGVPCSYDGHRNKPGLKSGVVDSLSQRLERVEKAVFGQQTPNDMLEGTRPPEWKAGTQSLPLESLATLAGACSTLVAELQDLSHPRKRARVKDQDEYSGNHQESRRVKSEGYLQDLFAAPGLPRLPAHTLVVMFEDMLDLYFMRVHPWVSMLREVSVREGLQDPQKCEALMVVLRAMTVATLRFIQVGGRSLNTQHVQRVTDKLKREILSEAMMNMTIASIQALTILAYVEIGDGNTTAAWPLIGSLTRTVEALGLSIEAEGRSDRSALLPSIASLPEPEDWLQEEERRRVFWNVFILDRFASMAQGHKPSLTGADVARRLPVDGGKWYLNQPALTPYFGIWDNSMAKGGANDASLSSCYTRPSRAGTSPSTLEQNKHGENSAKNQLDIDHMVNVGSLGYYIEATESLLQIKQDFLELKPDLTSPPEISDWLHQFQELDRRLVHWKVHLPYQWRDSGISREVMPGVMDASMTIANITHNISTILLHQRIAYPGADLQILRLPSEFSAETCTKAAIETTHIIRRYLDGIIPNKPVSPQMGLCAYISAKVLLVHSQHYKTQLSSEFQSLVQSLEQMHRHWRGTCGSSDRENSSDDNIRHHQAQEVQQSSFFLQLVQELAELQASMNSILEERISILTPVAPTTDKRRPKAATGIWQPQYRSVFTPATIPGEKETFSTATQKMADGSNTTRPSLLARYGPRRDPGSSGHTLPLVPESPVPHFQDENESAAADRNRLPPLGWSAPAAALATGGSDSTTASNTRIVTGAGILRGDNQPQQYQRRQSPLPNAEDGIQDYAALSDALMSHAFSEMDRVIGFDEFMGS